MANTTDPRGVDTGELRQIADDAKDALANGERSQGLGALAHNYIDKAADTIDQLRARVAEQDQRIAELERDAERLVIEHDVAQARLARTAMVLTHIHMLLHQKDIAIPTGEVARFSPEYNLVLGAWRELSSAIRRVPEDIDSAMRAREVG